MLNITEEVKAKLLEAKSEEEIRAIIADKGIEADEEEIVQIVKEISSIIDGKELSPDELDAIAGGWRDWYEEGCYATVEPDSWCAYSEDKCAVIYHHYDHEPARFKYCWNCGARVCEWGYEKKPGESTYSVKTRCPKCHAWGWLH